ncbi:MAG TPA: DUF2723 domain-containing protein, partial [Bacteroidales bacterium]|nr:DUF2723 domain-containing protein [Bacteroidales bacterium]
MNNYKKINIIAGWIVFAISAAVYILTIEPTASFWDCGEFIATSLKLQVGHPPGAPLFMILGRLFTMFAGGNTEIIPMTVNIMSALASAFTILFLFWTLTHLARKIVVKNNEITLGNTIAIIGAATVGSLAYTFSDSFWFSAVEGEVYASSSLFTAVVFWAILKWENVANEKYSNRWLILIAYLMGLSIGVHLLNLLTIPAIVLVYYFKKFNATPKGTFLALIISALILGTIMYVIIPGVFVVASKFELLFVNSFGLGYNSGVIFYGALLLGLVIWSLYYTYKHGKVVANTIILGVTVILIGYSSYGMIVIRSNANPPLNENDPSNLFSLLSYLNREQYGDRPLLSGPVYNAPIIDSEQGKPNYVRKDGKYVITSYKPEYVYDSRFVMPFPRMYSRENLHVNAYKEWGNVKGKRVQIQNEKDEPQTVIVPTFGENLTFFFRYQVGFMYWRYFMWNFSGRQNDIQGHGSPLKGNWITGIPFVDEALVGPQDKMPTTMKDNWSRNRYYMLPFILGMIGLFFQLNKHKKDFVLVMMLFIMTGLAIVVYLNQTPYQPRERDYAYAGSFYAFAIWIGLGVLALIDMIPKALSYTTRAGLASIVALFAVPVLMASENWDDHDRSGRFTARDFAYNYLNSCDKNAIIFTNGDNDTFPLWYLQEVENVRTDVRVVNLSYLGADWYIEQMQRKAYESDPLPFSMTKDKYVTGNRDIVYVVDRVGDYLPLKDAMDFVGSDLDETKTLPNTRERVDYIPARKLIIPVDSALVLKNGTVTKKQANKIEKDIRFELNKNALYKNDMMVLDLLANNNWKRPVYFAITVSDENYMNLQDYFRLDGLAYRIVPIKTKRTDSQPGGVDTDILYNNLINKFKWGGVPDPKVYLDENNLRMLSNFRNNFSRLAEELINEGKKDSAIKVLDKCMEIMPQNRVPFNYFIVPIIEQYYRAGEANKANKLVTAFFNSTQEDLRYYFSFSG